MCPCQRIGKVLGEDVGAHGLGMAVTECEYPLFIPIVGARKGQAMGACDVRHRLELTACNYLLRRLIVFINFEDDLFTQNTVPQTQAWEAQSLLVP